MTPQKLGAVAISIDVAARGASAEHSSRSSEMLIADLIHLLDRHEIGATWALAEGADAALEQILWADERHELAILGDAHWIGEAAGRSTFAQKLAQRSAAFQASGVAIGVLACRGACVPRSEYDLLVKHRIGVVRQLREVAGTAWANRQPQLLRHGVVETPPTVEFPRPSAWWGAGVRLANAAIDKAVASAGVAHLVLDLNLLAQHDRRLRGVERLLRRVVQYHRRDAVEALTLGQLGEKLVPTRARVSTRSILRAA